MVFAEGSGRRFRGPWLVLVWPASVWEFGLLGSLGFLSCQITGGASCLLPSCVSLTQET